MSQMVIGIRFLAIPSNTCHFDTKSDLPSQGESVARILRIGILRPPAGIKSDVEKEVEHCEESIFTTNEENGLLVRQKILAGYGRQGR